MKQIMLAMEKKDHFFPNGFRITFLLTAFFAACDTIKNISLEKNWEKNLIFFHVFFFF